MLPPFKNEPYVDFTQPEPRAKMHAALKYVEDQLGREYPLVICGERVTTDQKIVSFKSARPSQVVGATSSATPELANQAVKAAFETFPPWSNVEPEVRARYLLKAAAILRRRIYEFSAWIVFEVSKSWGEAYADTAEAIDFLEFYAREMIRLQDSHATTPYPGEEN